MRRRFMSIEEHIAVRCPCCDAVDVDTRHARICPRAGAQVKPALTVGSRDLPHAEAAGNPTRSRERRTVDCRPEPADEHRC